MSLAHQPLPADPQALQLFAADLQAELARQEIELTANATEIHVKTLHIEKLKMQLAPLRRARFGRSSEKLDRNIEQLELLISGLEEDLAAQDASAVHAPVQPSRLARTVLPSRPGHASAASRSANRCPSTCRARVLSTNRPAPARVAAAPPSAASVRTSAKCSNTSRPASR
jgi:hypothetical protein